MNAAAAGQVPDATGSLTIVTGRELKCAAESAGEAFMGLIPGFQSDRGNRCVCGTQTIGSALQGEASLQMARRFTERSVKYTLEVGTAQAGSIRQLGSTAGLPPMLNDGAQQFSLVVHTVSLWGSRKKDLMDSALLRSGSEKTW